MLKHVDKQGESDHLQGIPEALGIRDPFLGVFCPTLHAKSLKPIFQQCEFGFGKRGLLEKGSFQKVHFLEILENLEILEFLETSQTVEKKEHSDHFLEILENIEILEILEISSAKRPLS